MQPGDDPAQLALASFDVATWPTRWRPNPGDICVDKHRISGFWDTPLDSILRNLGIKTILFAGVNTDECVPHSLTDANFLGYGCVTLAECCAKASPEFCAEATI